MYLTVNVYIELMPSCKLLYYTNVCRVIQSYPSFHFLQLHSYISQLTRSVISKGLIDGLFLTGLTADGIKLLTNYVNQVS